MKIINSNKKFSLKKLFKKTIMITIKILGKNNIDLTRNINNK